MASHVPLHISLVLRFALPWCVAQANPAATQPTPPSCQADHGTWDSSEECSRFAFIQTRFSVNSRRGGAPVHWPVAQLQPESGQAFGEQHFASDRSFIQGGAVHTGADSRAWREASRQGSFSARVDAWVHSVEGISPSLGRCLIPGLCAFLFIVAITFLAVERKVSANSGTTPPTPANVAKEQPANPALDAKGTGSGSRYTMDKTRFASLSELFSYATRQDQAAIAVACLFSAFQGACTPGMFMLMGQMIMALFYPNDDGTRPPALGPHELRDQAIKQVTFACLMLGSIVFITRSVAVITIRNAAERQTREMQRRTFARLLQQGPAWHAANDAKDVSSWLGWSAWYMRIGIGESLIEIPRCIAIAITAFCLAIYQDWRVVLVMCVGMPVSVACGVVGGHALARRGQTEYSETVKAGYIANVALASVRTVVAFNGQKRATDMYNETLGVVQHHSVMAGVELGLSWGMGMALFFSTLSMAIFVDAMWILRGYQDGCWASQPPYGTCTTGATILSTTFIMIWGFVNGMSNLTAPLEAISSARGSVGWAHGIIETPLSISAGHLKPTAQVRGEITYKSVTFSYPGRAAMKALDDFSVEIESGTTVAFVGPSGSGKSTLMNLLLRFYEAQSGTICLDGYDISTLNLSWLRSKLAVVEQEPVLFSCSIWENIACGHTGMLKKGAVEEAAKLASAHDFLTALPLGYSTLAGERGVQLSGGQKQRIAIARALVRDPVVLLLDEATSALDSESEHLVQEALDRLLSQKLPAGSCRTTLIIAHRLCTVQKADQICVMKDGRLIERGAHVELLKDSGSMYKQLVELQLHSGAMLGASLVPHSAAGAAGGPADTAATPSSGSDSPGGGGAAVAPPLPASPAAPEPVSEVRAEEEKLAPPSNEVAAEPPEARAPEDSKDASPEADPKQDRDAWVLWASVRPEMPWWVLSFLGSVAVAGGSPMSLIMLSHATEVTTRPPARFDLRKFRWVADYDADAFSSAVDGGCLAMEIFSCVVILASLCQQYGARRFRQGVIRRLRVKALSEMLNQEIGWFDSHKSGALADWLASDIEAASGLIAAVAAIVMCALTLAWGLSVCFYFSWRLTLCLLASVPPVLLGTAYTKRFSSIVDRYYSAGLTWEVMNSMKIVAAFGLEDLSSSNYSGCLKKEATHEYYQTFVTAGLQGFAIAYTYLILGGIAFCAGKLISRGLLDPSSTPIVFLSLIATLGSLLGTAQSLDGGANSWKMVNKVFEALKQPAPAEGTGRRPKTCAGRIEFKNVSFAYPKRSHQIVLQNFNLIAEPGSVVALVGASGSGKSSAAGLLMRFYKPLSGAVTVDGADLRSLDIFWFREQVGYVQQEPVLWASSILENIQYGNPNATVEEVEAAARVASAHDFICALPWGYQSEAGARLSGGQKQRVAIARALVRNPTLLLLDEATSALDAGIEREVQDSLMLRGKAHGTTTIVIAHRLCTVQSANTIYVLNAGRLMEKGSHMDLMALPDGHYRRLVGRECAAALAAA